MRRRALRWSSLPPFADENLAKVVDDHVGVTKLRPSVTGVNHHGARVGSVTRAWRGAYWHDSRNRTRILTPALGHDQRDVVVLLLGTEELNLSDDRRDNRTRRLFPMTLERIDKALFPELLFVWIERLRHAVGIEREDVARRKLALHRRTLPVFEQAQNRARRLQPLQRAIAMQKQRRQMPAICIPQPPCHAVVLGKDDCGIGA